MSHNCGSLKYNSPAHGGWGIVRLAMLVPESYQLFVCPFACGRHGALGAIGHNIKDRLSYLYIEESDIVSGGYEDLIPEAVEELLETLETRPKVLMIFVSCLDDLLGTDHEAILAILRKKHPDVAFTFGHMNPITQDSDNPPPVNIRRKMYGLLKSSEIRENAVNILGNPIAVSPDSELFVLLNALGVETVHHISQCNTYEEFQKMAQARLNIVIATPAAAAAKDMKGELDIDHELALVNYRGEDILDTYYALIQHLQSEDSHMFDLTPYVEQARQMIQQTLNIVKAMPIYVDYTATARPFALARALSEAGFQVEGIFAPKVTPKDKVHADWIAVHLPGLKIIDPQGHNVPGIIGEFPKDSIAIGFESGYITRATHVYGMVNDEGNYGFHGVIRLMKGIAAAALEESDLEAMIKTYGLVI